MDWIRCCAVAAILAAVAAIRAEEIKSYHVGNSLTWDARPTAFADLSAQQGLDHVAGHHIRCGKSLPYIVRKPTETCYDEPVFGTWTEALPAYEWDVVTLQLYPDLDSTLGSETDAALNLIDTVQSNPANDDTRFIVYGAWPNQIDSDSYAEAWLADTDPDDVSSPSAHSRAYHQAAFQRIDAARPEADITFLSVGELFYMADTNIRSAVSQGDDWLGFEDVSEFYRDEFHMDSASGRWIASLAMWTAVTGGDASTLVRPDADFHPSLATDVVRRSGMANFVADSFDSIYVVPQQDPDCNDDEVLDAADLTCVETIEMRDEVLEALNSLPGDLDGNGVVSFEDFLTLARNFGRSPAAYTDGDIDLQGSVTGADFLAISANFGKVAPRLTTVPEGQGLYGLWLGTLGAASFRRRRMTFFDRLLSGDDQNRKSP